MDILEKLFGSSAKVRIMRLFLFNPDTHFDLEKIMTRAKISQQEARSNVRILNEIGLIKTRVFSKEVKLEPKPTSSKLRGSRKKGDGKRIVKRRVKGWILNELFPYLPVLQSFVITVSPLQDRMIVRKFNKTGNIKLLIVSGVFIQEKDSRVDIFIVGDGLRRAAIDATVKDIEAELGKDLTYSFFETKDFQYRLTMYDKLIRDILDYPHKKLVNKLGIQANSTKISVGKVQTSLL